MKNIIFIAAPAAGKGTQAKLLSLEYNVPHISTGDLLRDEVKSESELGKQLKQQMDTGALIADDIIVNLLRKRISKVDCNNGYILDGFPRNIEQAMTYDNLLHELGKETGTVIHMHIDKELTFKRTMSRLICETCGTSYNQTVPELSPAIAGICNKCGHTLKQRSDDNETTFINRYSTYQKETKPLLKYYQDKGILKEISIDENDTTEDIFNKIKAMIN